MARSFLNNSTVRGLRNNNPGNLRRTSNDWQGKIPFAQSKDSEFEQFYELPWGIRAFFINLETKFNSGQNTIAKFVSVYAPSNENDTQSYISQVASMVGKSATAAFTLNKDFMIKLAKAMFKIELGETAASKITQDCYEDGYFFFQNRNYQYGSDELPEMTITSKDKCQYCGQIIVGCLLFFFTLFTLTLETSETNNVELLKNKYNDKVESFLREK